MTSSLVQNNRINLEHNNLIIHIFTTSIHSQSLSLNLIRMAGTASEVRSTIEISKATGHLLFVTPK